MKTYKLINNVTGWVVFAIALTTYTLTLEPTASFWDCGEFISGADKLEVVHPPGAPLFLVVGRIFTLFAGGDTSKVAYMINFFSGFSLRTPRVAFCATREAGSFVFGPVCGPRPSPAPWCR